MKEVDTLRYARNLLLSLHKSLLDFERESYERLHGRLSAGQFLNVILEDANFAWLRKFSMLIVEIDEMFDLRDGVSDELVSSNLDKIRDLVEMKDADEYFRAKYRYALDNDARSAQEQARLEALMG